MQLHIIDVVVLLGTLLFIVFYGAWKTRKNNNLESYLLGGKSMKWGTIGLSVMATQASAITFLSTPGLAYDKGMEFVQNYFAMPIALVIICAVFIPIYYKLKVYTAYEFLEKRFDLKTRLLGAALFLVQRGLAAGLTIYAPAIIVSAILGWNLNATIIAVGVLVVVYTVAGGSKAVSLTQKWQMAIIMGGMFLAFFITVSYFPENVSFNDALRVAGKMDKLNAVDASFDLNKRYTIWSGLFASIFLFLSYFGTDQSQVSRYLTGKNVAESRIGLMFNAMLKVPMQFFILFVGIMVFVFYQFQEPPLIFHTTQVNEVTNSVYAPEYEALSQQFSEVHSQKQQRINELLQAFDANDDAAIDQAATALNKASVEVDTLRSRAFKLIQQVDDQAEAKDSDYVFLTFVMGYLPQGVVGLLIAVIFSAAMSSTSSELNALASTSMIDFYKRLGGRHHDGAAGVRTSRLLTLMWGGIAIVFALIARQVESLVELINIIGSLFYGTILGIFLVAFFIKKISGNAIFAAALISQAYVIILFNLTDYGYLWFNFIGVGVTVGLAVLFQLLISANRSTNV